MTSRTHDTAASIQSPSRQSDWRPFQNTTPEKNSCAGNGNSLSFLQKSEHIVQIRLRRDIERHGASTEFRLLATPGAELLRETRCHSRSRFPNGICQCRMVEYERLRPALAVHELPREMDILWRPKEIFRTKRDWSVNTKPLILFR